MNQNQLKTLAKDLLDDDHGISYPAYMILQTILNEHTPRFGEFVERFHKVQEDRVFMESGVFDLFTN